MGFTEKTNYLLETKSLLKDRINSLGGSITEGTTFRDYLVWLDSLYETLDEKTITGLPDSLEGKCEQEGTPTPTSPQPINITTGRQVVSVCGKNFFNDTLRQGVTTYNTGQWSNSNSRITSTDWIPLKAGTYTISAETAITGNRYLQISCVTFDTSGNFYNISGVSGQWQRLPFTFTTPIDLNWKCNISFNDSYSLTPSDVYDIQVEKGSSSSSYEEYKGNDYEINLGKNLWNYELERAEYNSSGTKVSTNVWLVNTTKIPVLPNTTYSISQSEHPIQYRIICFNGATYLSQIQNSINTTTGYSSYTFTTPNNCNGIYIQFRSTIERIAQGTYTVELTDITNVQLEKGTYASSYSPYKTPIYLGKIGTYQDYIFKNTQDNPLYNSNLEEGQWYIHKEIGRVVLNGSETWWANGDTTNYGQYAMNLTDKGFGVSNLISSHFITGLSNQKNCIAGRANNNVIAITIEKSIVNYNVNDFKTWLSSNNVEVCYVLNTPTNTLIEDEELINQLNEIDIFTVISEDFYN